MDINRKTAYDVLFDIEKNGAYSNIALNHHIADSKPDNEGFVRQLVYGVLENRILIDYYLDVLIPSGVKKLKKQDLTLLRMGVYQLRYMDSVPSYAAVNETVNMAKRLARGRERFVNGVLRGYIKNADSIKLPGRNEDPAKYLSIMYSVSPWIASLWLGEYGLEKTEEILKAAVRTPDMVIRVNTLKTTADELADMLGRKGFAVKRHDKAGRALVVSGARLLATEEYANGLFSVQDAASIMASDALGAKPGDTVIDVCAAPGGKSLATAELMANQGRIISNDIYEHKLSLIEKEAARLGVDIIETRCGDSTVADESLAGIADAVLADVPCSGLGVIARKPEIKYKEGITKAELDELTDRQARILAAASTYVKPGGTLVYSTCTINRAENEAQVENFLKAHDDFDLESMRQLLPTDGTDGFFIAKLKRSA